MGRESRVRKTGEGRYRKAYVAAVVATKVVGRRKRTIEERSEVDTEVLRCENLFASAHAKPVSI